MMRVMVLCGKRAGMPVWALLLGAVLATGCVGLPDGARFRHATRAERLDGQGSDAVVSAGDADGELDLGTDAGDGPTDAAWTDAEVTEPDGDSVVDSSEIPADDAASGTDAELGTDAPLGTDAIAATDADDAAPGPDAVAATDADDAAPGSDTVAATDADDAALGTDAVAAIDAEFDVIDGDADADDATTGSDAVPDPCAVTNCDDQNVCTSDSCESASGCLHAIKAGSCDDGDACTLDSCSKALGCQHADKTNCGDGNACTDDACDKSTGACTHTNNSTPCSDGKACTTESCTGGTCNAKALTCDVHATCGEPGGCICNSGYVGDGKSCSAANPIAGMVLISGATFWMGCNATKDTMCGGFANEGAQHKVTLSSYYMDATEATTAAWQACVAGGACAQPDATCLGAAANTINWDNAGGKPKVGRELHPVNCVSWTEAQKYCKWRGAGFDLPTEAQWEMAARGSCELNGSKVGDDAGCKAAMRTYPWGETNATCTFATMANSAPGCGSGTTAAVGSKTAGDSPYGLHDMAGNLAEWARDWYSSPYPLGSPTDPEFKGPGTTRLIRGGHFANLFINVRAGFRNTGSPGIAPNSVGLRCVRSFTLCTANTECADPNPCTTETCQNSACQHDASDGGACTDGDVCTVTDVCKGGACLPGAVTSCDDGIACTDDACALGCQHVTNNAGCDDGDPCTVDVCNGVTIRP